MMNIKQWLIFEERVRQAPDVETLQMIVVNLLHQVFPYSQAILFESFLESFRLNKFKTKAASNISEINEYSSTIQWLDKTFYPQLDKQYKTSSFFAAQDLNITFDSYFANLGYGLYLPLHSPIMGHFGLVFWFKEPPAQEILDFSTLITSTITHSWERLLLQKRSNNHLLSLFNRKKIIGGIVVILLLSLLIRIDENTIAPAEISPEHPSLIAPSINGTVSDIRVMPNEPVKKDQILFKLDDITILNQLEESQQNLNVANQRYLKAYRHAYTDQSSRDDLLALEGEKQQAVVNYQYHEKLLARTSIKSPVDGVVLYSDPNDWLGKPVKIGEKIMLVANPAEKAITFWIPIDNMITVDKNIPINFYSNENPTTVTKASIVYINPIAEVRPDNVLAFFGVAHITSKNTSRLGEQGTVKLFGNKVSLVYYIFKRPIRYIRQHLGI